MGWYEAYEVRYTASTLVTTASQGLHRQNTQEKTKTIHLWYQNIPQQVGNIVLVFFHSICGIRGGGLKFLKTTCFLTCCLPGSTSDLHTKTDVFKYLSVAQA